MREWHDSAAMLSCPRCGADRLVPLTFPVYRREAGSELILRRPMAKCAGCGERIYAHIEVSQAAPTEPDARKTD
jgi:hypothetical protein